MFSLVRVGVLRSFFRCIGICCVVFKLFFFVCDVKFLFIIDDFTMFFGDLGVVIFGKRKAKLVD